LARRQTFKPSAAVSGSAAKPLTNGLRIFAAAAWLACTDRSRRLAARPNNSPRLGSKPSWIGGAASALGGQENLAAAPPDFSAPPGAVCALYSSVLAAGGAVRPHPRRARKGPFLSHRMTRPSAQPGVDRGFQGLVLHRRWPAAGAVDRAHLFSRYGLCLRAAQSGRHGRRRVFQRLFVSGRLPGHHPGWNGSPFAAQGRWDCRG